MQSDAVLDKVRQGQAYYAKAMEMIGIFGAGTIGFVVALRPQNELATHHSLKVAVALLFVSVISTVFWLMGKGLQSYSIVNQLKNNPDSIARAKEPWWARLARVAALSSFISAYYFLFDSL